MNCFHAMAGESPGRVPATLDLRPPLKEAWSAEVCAGRIRPETLLAADGVLISRAADGSLVALDAESGRRLWGYPWDGSPMLIAGGQLHVSVVDGEVHVVDLHTGRPTRCIPSPGADDSIFIDSLIVAWRQYPAHGPGTVACVEQGTGRRLWTHTLPADSHGTPRLAAASGVVAITHGKGDVHALDLRSGAVRWKRSWPDWSWGHHDSVSYAPVFAIFALEDRLVLEIAGHILALDLGTGETLWEARGLRQYCYGGYLFSIDRTLYETRSVADGSLTTRVEAARGRPKAISSGWDREKTIVRVSETHVFLEVHGALVAMDRQTGEYCWSFRPKGASGIRGEALAVSGRLYFRNWDRLFCLRQR